MNLINLLPHPVHILMDDHTHTIPPSGRVARVNEHEEDSKPIGDIATSSIILGGVSNLPDCDGKTKYIVSKVVLMAINRPDIYCPMGVVRDDNGYVVGCTHLGRRA